MRGFRLSSLGLLAALALTAFPASAMASKQLVLSEGEEPVPTGAPAYTGVSIAGCVLFAEGEMSVNQAGKDKIKGTSTVFTECSEETESVTGTINETQMSGSGKVTIKTKIELGTPGPCVYAFKTLKAEFTIPGPTVFAGSTEGKLNKKVSSATCEKTIVAPFEAENTSSSLLAFQAKLKS